MDVIAIVNTSTILISGVLTTIRTYQYIKSFIPKRKTKKNSKNDTFTEDDFIL